MKITDRIKNFINRNNTALSAENEQVDKRINEKANEIEKLYIEKKENGADCQAGAGKGKPIRLYRDKRYSRKNNANYTK